MRRNKKILFVLPLPPPVHGSSIVSKQICDHFSLPGVEADFINLATSRTMGEVYHTDVRKMLRGIAIYFRVLWALVRRHYDLCYLAPAVSPGGLLKDIVPVLLFRLFRRPIILHMHGKGVRRHQQKRGMDVLYRLLFRNSKVILLSMRLNPDLEKYVKKEDVFICPNGVPDPMSEPVELRCSDAGGIRLIFLSNLLKDKGVLDLLDGCAILKKRYGLDFQCTLVGGETVDFTRETIQREIDSRNLQDCVHYVGPKYGQEKIRELQNSDLMVFPTRYKNECFPLVLLEALACGVPLIASDEGAIPDIVGEDGNGFLLHENFAEEIAEKVMLYAKLPGEERLRMRKNARRSFERRFTEERFLQNFTGIIRQTLGTE